MDYITVKEAALRWGYSEATIRKWCNDGNLKVTLCAKKENGHWQIPVEAKCPKKIRV